MRFETIPPPMPGAELDQVIQTMLVDIGFPADSPAEMHYSTDEGAALRALDCWMIYSNWDHWELYLSRPFEFHFRLSATKWGDNSWPPEKEWIAAGRAHYGEWPREDGNDWQGMNRKIRALAICRGLHAAWNADLPTPKETN